MGQESGEIESVVQDILDNNHKEHQKRQITKFPERLNFACPICGDSHKFANKKRGNIYLKNMWYKCFNCGATMPLLKFYEKMNVRIDPESIMAIDEQTRKYQAEYNRGGNLFEDFQLDNKILFEDFVNHVNSDPEIPIFDMKPIDIKSGVGRYLILDRHIEQIEYFHQAIYKKPNGETEPVLISLNRAKNIIVGMQLRNLKKRKDRRFYKIYNFEDLWNMMPNVQPLTEKEYIKYNKLSYLYNILNVDFSKPITVFEGYLDAVLVPNSIGLVGVNTDYSFLLEAEIDLRFFFDNDKDGQKKTREMLMQNYPVFLWRKFIKDMSTRYSNPQKMRALFENHFGDLGNVAEQFQNPYITCDLENYFSKDKFDLINI